MCVEIYDLTPYLCHHVALEGRSTAPLRACGGCGNIQQTNLRKKPGAPIKPCKECSDDGSWVLCEETWMPRREALMQTQMTELMQEANKRVDAARAKYGPSPATMRSAEEARDRVNSVFEREEAEEKRKRDEARAAREEVEEERRKITESASACDAHSRAPPSSRQTESEAST